MILCLLLPKTAYLQITLSGNYPQKVTTAKGTYWVLTDAQRDTVLKDAVRLRQTKERLKQTHKYTTQLEKQIDDLNAASGVCDSAAVTASVMFQNREGKIDELNKQKGLLNDKINILNNNLKKEKRRKNGWKIATICTAITAAVVPLIIVLSP